MSRKITMGADWNAMRPWLNDGRVQLWSRFPTEVAPDLIVTPLLFLTKREPRGRRHEDVCTLEPLDLLVMHARGEEHLAQLLQEVAPRLAHLRFAYVLDADARTLHAAGRSEPACSLDELPSVLRRAVMGAAADRFADVIDLFCKEQSEAVANLPTREEAEAFRALPEILRPISRAAPRRSWRWRRAGASARELPDHDT